MQMVVSYGNIDSHLSWYVYYQYSGACNIILQGDPTRRSYGQMDGFGAVSDFERHTFFLSFHPTLVPFVKQSIVWVYGEAY